MAVAVATAVAAADASALASPPAAELTMALLTALAMALTAAADADDDADPTAVTCKQQPCEMRRSMSILLLQRRLPHPAHSHIERFRVSIDSDVVGSRTIDTRGRGDTNT